MPGVQGNFFFLIQCRVREGVLICRTCCILINVTQRSPVAITALLYSGCRRSTHRSFRGDRCIAAKKWLGRNWICNQESELVQYHKKRYWDCKWCYRGWLIREVFWLRFGNIHVDELPLGCQQTVGNGITSSVDSESERSESEAWERLRSKQSAKAALHSLLPSIFTLRF